MAVPTYFGKGTYRSATTAITDMDWPASHAVDDIGVCGVETRGSQGFTIPSGWTEHPNSPQIFGAGGTAVRLTVFWKRATSTTEADITIPDSGNHQSGIIHVIRGCVATGNPFSATSGDGEATADTSASIAGATTSTIDNLVLIILAGGNEATVSGWTNSDLTSVTEQSDDLHTLGNDGHIAAATGIRATAGAYGATTATTSASVSHAGITMAMTPTAPPSNFNQRHWRGRKVGVGYREAGVGLNAAYDAGDPAEDTNFDSFMDEEVRLRFKMEENNSSGAVQFKLQYKKNAEAWTDAGVSQEAWPPVAGEAPGGTPKCFIVETADFVDGAATSTERLTVLAGTYVAGDGNEDNLSASWNNNLDNGEWVFSVVIPRWYDSGDQGLENADGDTFGFRLVTSAGVAQTYDQDAVVTARFRVGHIGGTYIEQPTNIGPFWDGNGNMYLLTEHTNASNTFFLAKSTNGGDTWLEATTTGRPAELDFEGVDIFPEGTDFLHFLGRRGAAAGFVYYHRFNMSSAASNPDTWQAADDQVTATAGDPVADTDSVAIVRRAAGGGDGDRFAFYTGLDGGNTTIFVSRWDAISTAWQTAIELDTTVSTNFTAVTAVLDENDDIQIFYLDFSNGVIYRKELASGGDTLSARTSVATGLATSPNARAAALMPAIHYDDGGVDVEVISWLMADDFLDSLELRDGTAQTILTNITEFTVDKSHGTSHQPVASITAEGLKVHLLYGRLTDFDLYGPVTSDDGGSWLPTTNPEEQDGVTAHYVRGRVGTHSAGNGGDTVLGYFWDQGSNGDSPGFTRYDEIVLVAGGAKVYPPFPRRQRIVTRV